MATKRRVTVQEAADMLGISQEAVRMRVKRGTLESEKRGGRVYILFNTDPTQEQTQDRTGDQGGRIDELRNRVADLQAEVEAWREESRRKDHIIAGLVERLPPAIEPPEPQNQAENAEPRSDRGGTPPPESEKATERPSLWRKIFGR